MAKIRTNVNFIGGRFISSDIPETFSSKRAFTLINFWASDLDDVTVVEKMPNVETISLSLNKISSLSFFKSCKNLKELFLRKNKICNLKEIHFLKNLPNLEVLWLWDNPFSSHPHYRLYIVKMLPKLK